MFRVQVSGFRVQGLGFRVRGSGFRVQGSGFRVQGPGSRVQGSGFRVQGSGFRVQGSGFGVQGLGFGPTCGSRCSILVQGRNFKSDCSARLSEIKRLKSLCKSQFPHKSVNLFYILVMIKGQVDEFVRELTVAKRLEKDFL